MIEAALQAVVAIVVAGLSVLGAVLATERTSGLQRRIKHNVGILKDTPEGRARAGLEATLELQVEAYAKRETARIKRKVNWGSVFWTVVFTLLCLWAVSGCVSWWLSSGGNPLAVTVTIVVGLFSALFVGAALSTIYNPSAKDKKAAAAAAAAE